MGSKFAFIKWTMVLFNLILILGGLTLLATGMWVSVDGGPSLQILGPFSSHGTQFVNVGFFCIAVGAGMVPLGLLGCWGGQKESKCLLLTFFSIILVIFISEVGTAVVVLAFSSFAAVILQAWATPALQQAYGADPVLTHIWNTTMTEMKCCGFTNYTDFMGPRFEREISGGLPPSCCWTNTTPCSWGEAARSAVQGCSQQILEELQEHASIVGGVAAGTAVLQITAMILSASVYCHLDNTDS